MSNNWTLEDLYTGVRRSWRVLAAIVLAFIAIGVAAWAVMPQTYTATAQHTVEPITVLSSGSSFNTVNMETERLVATSASVLGRAADELDDASVEALREATVVQVPRGSQVLEFDVTTGAPERSAAWANAVASAYGAQRADNAREVVAQTTAELAQSIERLQTLYNSQPARSDAREATQLQLDALLEQQARLEATPFFPGALVTPATPVSQSNRPSIVVFATGGLFLGLMVGGIAALMVTRLRRPPVTVSGAAAAGQLSSDGDHARGARPAADAEAPHATVVGTDARG